MKKLVLLLLILLVSIPVYAGNVHIFFFDSSTNDKIVNSLVKMQVNSQTNVYFVNESLDVNLTSSDKVYFILDDPKTIVNDYFSELNLDASESKRLDVFAYPIGNLQVITLDSDNRIISGAAVKIDCANNLVSYPEFSDDFGFVSVPNVYAGYCDIVGKTSDSVGMNSVIVKKGDITKVELILVKNNNYSFIWFIVVIVFIVLVVFFVFRFRKILKKKKQPDKVISALFKTLNENEKKVVSYLLEKHKSISQAEIRHKILLPRTTLSRILLGLEKKNIVDITRDGKVVWVKINTSFSAKK